MWSADAPAVEVDDLVKRYRKAKVNAVDGISLRVEAGEFFALLGPNGAGKTTTISILTTTLAPTSGRIRICGYELAKEPSEVRRRVGIIFQNPSLDRNLSGEENVRLHAILYGLYPYRPAFRLMPDEYRTQVRELAAVLGMETDIQQPVKKLSGGMQRKLEIIRGLMHRPSVLFLDEPTRGLDVASRRSLWAYLREVRERYRVTIVLTTHYLEEAEQADRLCILNHGRIVAMGSPGEVRLSPAEEFLELDATDRAQLRLELKKLNLNFEEDGAFTVRLDGRSAHEVIRSLDVPLTRLRTRQPSLEDAYLKILADE
ncbi:MAG: ABC transporter ATP-binding protein [Chloroflexi bacterium]|nr:MAG: ABC transporter ATP-binding protein [Chloroflexota bacterium]TMF70092.1 MAG: ABC transporter ATP-binding protein [Chloroflexota bacterium]TMF76605.1 MAG: ABC transporter ATP-binding protein [Chloroflexota bacterium]TMG42359.1 MAG: ABC transporter ATP-binding protein [Chloroflexota bacterium]